ncbi:MAG: saccharopine dehydrogenase family protein [Actinomycetota bacterium]
MRVVVLGAASPTGRRVSRDLAEQPEVTRLDLADDDLTAIRSIASQLDSPKAKVLEMPLAHSDLAGQIGGSDLALGCLDSRSELEVEAARAAIDGRVPYLSGSPDIDAIEKVLALDGAARSAGTLIVPGLSWTPGVTNLLTRAGSQMVDGPLSVRIAWTVSPVGRDAEAALVTACRAFSASAAVFDRGTWSRELPGGGEEEVFFPDPVGWREVTRVAGAEVLTLPIWLQGLERAVVKGGVGKEAFDRILRWLARKESVSRDLLRTLARFLTRTPRLGMGIWSAARVDVYGTRHGAPAGLAFGILDQISNLAAAPLVSGALLMARGGIAGSGVLPPEAVIDPRGFFALLAERGLRVARLERGR